MNLPNLPDPRVFRDPTPAKLHELQLIALRTESATKVAAASSMAAALITAAGRPHTMEEALTIMHDCFHAMFPDINSGRYQEWKAREDRFSRQYT